MKLLILGATGRTGRHVLKKALDQGYIVHCLVRDKTKVNPHTNLSIFEGHPQNRDALQSALTGCDVVLNILNVSRKSDFPWSGLRAPKTLLSDTMRELISLSEQHPLQRVVICSAWGVGETKKDLPGWFRAMIDHSNIGAAYADHERQEQMLMDSSLSWTIVRPSGLTNTKEKSNIIVSYNNTPKPKLMISRLSVATFMLKAITDDSLVGKAPVISA